MVVVVVLQLLEHNYKKVSGKRASPMADNRRGDHQSHVRELLVLSKPASWLTRSSRAPRCANTGANPAGKSTALAGEEDGERFLTRI